MPAIDGLSDDAIRDILTSVRTIAVKLAPQKRASAKKG